MQKQKQIFLIIFSFCILLTIYPAHACKCLNPEIDELYTAADIVMLAEPDGPLDGDKQKMKVNTLIKGILPEGDLYVLQQKGTCGYDQLPVAFGREYLMLLNGSKGSYRFTTKCYNYFSNNDYYLIREKDGSHAHIHRDMVPAFLKNKGKIPKLKLYTSLRYINHKSSYDNWLSITNLEDQDIEILHPSNRKAFTFHITDSMGNIVQPEGFAKTDPLGGALEIGQGGAFNYELPTDGVHFFPFLTNTGLFGYKLEKKKPYTISVTYRPYGGRYGAITSEETEIIIYQ